MNTENMKNIVVLKDIKSNIVEEAFVILKHNKKAKKFEYIEKNNEDKKNKDIIKNPKEYILKEAEMIVNNYIADLEKSKNYKKLNKLEMKCKKFKFATIILTGIIVIKLLIEIL